MRTYQRDDAAKRLGNLYWGVTPLPAGGTLQGFYKDAYRSGALIMLEDKKIWCCGNAGSISTVPPPSSF